MKQFSILLGLVFLAGLAACGGVNDDVTRATSAPFEFIPYEAEAPNYQSSRSAVDLLSFG